MSFRQFPGRTTKRLMTGSSDRTALQEDSLGARTVRGGVTAPRRRTTTTSRRTVGLTGSVVLSTSMSALVVVSSWQAESQLGAPLYWAWVLTGLQVLALWAAGNRHWWAWLLGAGVQPVWIVYALLTDQVGFVPGCLISAAVQVSNFFGEPDETGEDLTAARPCVELVGWC